MMTNTVWLADLPRSERCGSEVSLPFSHTTPHLTSRPEYRAWNPGTTVRPDRATTDADSGCDPQAE